MRWIVVLATAGLVMVAVLVGSVGAEQAALPVGNLVKSPGFEAQPATHSSAEQSATYAPRGWERSGIKKVGEPETPDKGFVVARYGGPGTGVNGYFPTKAVATAIGGGLNFLYGGYTNNTAIARQTIDVSASTTDIDGGGVKVCLSGYLGGTRDWADYTIRVDVALLNDAEAKVGDLHIGPVYPGQRNNETTLIRRSAERAVPAGTRMLSVVLRAESPGGPLYAYADNISVALTKGNCEPLLTVNCVKKALVATVTPSAVAKTQRVRFSVKGGKRTNQAQDARAPYTARIAMNGLTGRLTVTAAVQQAGSGPVVLTKRSKHC